MTGSRRRVAGFSLVEVLVAVVLLSIGLLGLAKLQFWGVRHTGSAYFRTQATQIANEMAERLRANPGGVATGAYNLNPGGCASARLATPVDCRKLRCDDPADLAAFDLFSLACGNVPEGNCDAKPIVCPGSREKKCLDSGVDDLLPGGGMRVACSDIGTGKRRCRVEVCWDEADAQDAESIVVLEVVP